MLVAFLINHILDMEQGVKQIKTAQKSLHLCSQYSVIWFVINLMI